MKLGLKVIFLISDALERICVSQKEKLNEPTVDQDYEQNQLSAVADVH